MLDADECPFSGAGVADDERGRAVGPQLARIGEAGAAQTVSAPSCGGIEGRAIRRFAGDRAQFAELFGETIALGADVAVEGIAGHAIEYGVRQPTKPQRTQYTKSATWITELIARIPMAIPRRWRSICAPIMKQGKITSE